MSRSPEANPSRRIHPPTAGAMKLGIASEEEEEEEEGGGGGR